jgi:hypothetical protein
VEKHKLVEKLGSIGSRRDEFGQVDVDQQLRAIQLLLSYGYGPPRAENGLEPMKRIMGKPDIENSMISSWLNRPDGRDRSRGLIADNHR